MHRFEHGNDSPVVVIGSGAGGGTLGHELARRGVPVVCLEAGPWVRRADIVTNEAAMLPKITWLEPRIGSGDLAHGPMPVLSGRNVGGTTLRWTATALRFKDYELKARSVYGAIQEATLADWPLSLEELLPYYANAEKRMGVAGRNGIPFLPAANNFKVMAAGARRLGYREISTAYLAINPLPFDGRERCTQMGFCSSACPVDAKWTTENSEIPKAVATGRYELRPESTAVRIEHDGAGRVRGVLYVDRDGRRHEQKARAVCVACNAVDSARLLLASESARFAQGLANRSGEVGRNFMRHMLANVIALMPGPVHMHRGTMQAGGIYDEHRNDPARGFVGGYKFEVAPYAPVKLAGQLVPGAWGRKYAAALEGYRRMAGMMIVGEDLPQATNRVTLHPSEKDRYGLSVPVVHYEHHPNSVAMRHHALERGAAIYQAVGAEKVYPSWGQVATHLMGTCRMSADPERGVVDAYGRCHDVPNLFVSDAAVFPTSGAPNPTLTIVALAIRQAEHIAARMQRGEL